MGSKPKSPLHADVHEKKITRTQQAFADWLTENTGYEVDAESVKLAVRLTTQFRQSPEIAAAREARRAELAKHAETVAENRTKRAEARAAALEAKAEAIRNGTYRGPGRPRKEAPAEVAEATAEAKPAKASKPKAAKPAAAPKPSPKPALAVVVDDEDDDDDF
jgi:hypothetical protein